MHREATAVVLAGGQGSRLRGLDKLYLEVAGRRLLDGLAATLAPLFSELVAVSSRPEAFEGLPFRVVPDSIPGGGPLAGLHAGLLASGTGWVYLVACDMPYFSAAWADVLLARAAGLHPGTECGAGTAGSPMAFLACRGEYLEPFHGLYHRDLAEPIRASLTNPDPERGGRPSSIQRFMRTQRFLGMSPAGFPDIFHNINTPEELAELDRLAGLTEWQDRDILTVRALRIPVSSDS